MHGDLVGVIRDRDHDRHHHRIRRLHGTDQKLGRILVLAGLLTTALGAGLFLTVVNQSGLHANAWILALVTLVIGIGGGTCFGSIFDTALGDIDHDEAGAASGSLSAVQQLAAGIGSAVVTTVYVHTMVGGQSPLRCPA